MILLTTERLTLRDFLASDWEAVLAYQQDPLYLRYNEWASRTPEEVRDFVQKFIDQQRQEPRSRYQVAITLKTTGQLIGNCGIRRDSLSSATADLGYELDPRFWGKGYATEAACALLDFGFSRMGLERVAAWCLEENAASARVLEKLGMHLESRLRAHRYFKGRWWDALSFAISRDAWETQRRRLNPG